MIEFNVVVVGAGPSGLYFAYLLKKSRPHYRIRVLEQNSSDATFGFGVVLADRGLERLEAADSESAAALRSHLHLNQDQVIHYNGQAVLVDRVGYGGAIGRLDLLQILQRLCAKVGVELVFNRRVEADGSLVAADLVVGADGVNSYVRGSDPARFGTRIVRLTNHFAWYGTQARFERAGLSFKQYANGHFVGHYYPYSESMGTFVAECDDATWRRLEFDAMSDVERQKLVETAFRDELGGHPLIHNNSIWRQFPVIANDRWYVENRVLIGDALHSAHFSIGSGTRIAMADSIGLWGAMLESSDVSEALARFQAIRAPIKSKLLDAARASYTWYEAFPQKLEGLTPLDFVYDFMMRTGRMGDDRLRNEHPKFMMQYEQQRRGSIALHP